ncbi:hypothetical protein Tco_1344564 [Tanacetum coccineum]
METQKPLLKDEDGEEVDVHMYRLMIGSWMYLTSSRPDIIFAVCAYARYQVNPKVSHFYDVKRIFRYLKGQPKLGLWYPKDSFFDFVAYTDSDYAGASLDMKSTIGGCQFLGCRLISWQCKKQTVVAHSITEAEYVAALSCCTDISEITRKSSKTSKHGHENGRVHKSQKQSQEKSNPQSNSQRKVNLGQQNDEEDLGKDASKQGRRINSIDTDEDITLVSVQDNADKEMFDVESVNDESLGESTTTKSTPTISSQQSHDKGKGITIEESVKPIKKKYLIRLDEEVALKLQVKFDVEYRLAREKAEKEKEASIALIKEWDDIQAKIDVDYQLAERLQAQEQEELSVEEKATLFQQLLEKRKKAFCS